MVCPECEAFREDEKEFRRSALLLLEEIRDYQRRTCEVVERLMGKQSDDPRYRGPDVYRNRG